jgi:hypothetical protein
MQGYIKGTVGPFIPEHYNGKLEASMQGYNKGTPAPFLPVHYNG